MGGKTLAGNATAPAQDDAQRASKWKKRFERRPRRGWHIIEHKGGWEARVTDPFTYQRESKRFPTKLEAETWAEMRRAQLRLGQSKVSKTTFQTIVDQYLADLNRRSRAQLHIDTVTRFLDMATAGGLTDLADANAISVITNIVSGLKTRAGKPASPQTRNNFLARLRGVAHFAVQRGLLYTNPLVKIPYQKTVKRTKEVFTLDEIGRLIDPAHKDHPFYRAFCCLIYTGFRQREVRFMRWDWFLWDDLRINMILDRTATATLTDEQRQKVFIPKNGRARMTRLMEELVTIMKPDGDLAGPVFPDLQTVDTTGFQRRFDAYVADCGVTIGDRTPHSTRHTWTCCMLASGENQILVQQYAGHSESDMTGHYARQQDQFRTRITKAGWERGELRFLDFAPGGKCYREKPGVVVGSITSPPAAEQLVQ